MSDRSGAIGLPHLAGSTIVLMTLLLITLISAVCADRKLRSEGLVPALSTLACLYDELIGKTPVASVRLSIGPPPFPEDKGRQQKAGCSSGTEIGPYRILEPLGSGGMGTVYRTTHKKLNREVALKLLQDWRWHSADAVERFEREIQLVGQLVHPNIVMATDAGEQIFASQNPGNLAGFQIVTYTVPQDSGGKVVVGDVNAVFRISETGGLSHSGDVGVGERIDTVLSVNSASELSIRDDTSHIDFTGQYGKALTLTAERN